VFGGGGKKKPGRLLIKKKEKWSVHPASAKGNTLKL
jgi:hypothetical protein